MSLFDTAVSNHSVPSSTELPQWCSESNVPLFSERLVFNVGPRYRGARVARVSVEDVDRTDESCSRNGV